MHLQCHQPPAWRPASAAPKAQRGARNPGSGRFTLLLGVAAAALLLHGVSTGCRRQRTPASPAACTLIWPSDVPLHPECRAASSNSTARWRVAGPDEAPDVTVVADPDQADCQPLDDLLTKTVLLVGNPAPDQRPIAGSFAALGFCEIEVQDGPEMRLSLDRLLIDLVVLCMPDAAGRQELAQSLAARQPPARFTTYQPEKGQTDLAERTRDLLGPPAREQPGGCTRAHLLRNAQGRVVGIGRSQSEADASQAPEAARCLGLPRHVATRRMREAAFAAICSWVEPPS